MTVNAELCGPFELQDRTHGGDRADVFVATRTGPGNFHETLALKRLLPHLAVDPGQRAALRREAGRVAAQSHPSFPRLVERGMHQGIPWFATQWAAGVPVTELVTRGALDGQVIPLAAGVWLTLAVADALEHFHGHGPGAFPGPRAHANLGGHSVLVRSDGHVWVLGLRGEPRRSARRDWMQGTPVVTSPEQAAGRRPDERSDVFALGALLWHVLFGQPGFAGRDADELAARLGAGEMTWPDDLRNDIPEDLQEILFMALDVDPAQRFQTVAGFAQILRTCADGHGWTHGRDLLAAWTLERLGDHEVDEPATSETDEDEDVLDDAEIMDLEPEIIELSDMEVVLEEDEPASGPPEDSTHPIELARLPSGPIENTLIWEEDELTTLPFAG